MTEAEELQAIHARCNAATPGPWRLYDRGGVKNLDARNNTIGWEVEGPAEPMLRGLYDYGRDADFVAHARTDIPFLLAKIERLTAENEELRSNPPALIYLPEGIGVEDAEKLRGVLEVAFRAQYWRETLGF